MLTLANANKCVSHLPHMESLFPMYVLYDNLYLIGFISLGGNAAILVNSFRTSSPDKERICYSSYTSQTPWQDKNQLGSFLPKNSGHWSGVGPFEMPQDAGTSDHNCVAETPLPGPWELAATLTIFARKWVLCGACSSLLLLWSRCFTFDCWRLAYVSVYSSTIGWRSDFYDWVGSWRGGIHHAGCCMMKK